MKSSMLSTAQIVGEARRLLESNGFSNVGEARDESGLIVHVFEDARSIVGVCAFDSWSDLERQWRLAQSQLVERISSHLSRGQHKAWEGYLVLMTAGNYASSAAVAEIRSDTGRFRKLVATGEEMRSLEAIATVLSAVLPLDLDHASESTGSIWERLPGMLHSNGIDIGLARAALDAVEQNRSLMDGVRDWLRAS